MTTIHIKIKYPLISGAKYPFFVTQKGDEDYFWMVTEKCQGQLGRDGYYKATFLGNSNYYPFQYKGEILLTNYKVIKNSRVVLQFD